jgi:hypothetical protein
LLKRRTGRRKKYGQSNLIRYVRRREVAEARSTDLKGRSEFHKRRKNLSTEFLVACDGGPCCFDTANVVKIRTSNTFTLLRSQKQVFIR